MNKRFLLKPTSLVLLITAALLAGCNKDQTSEIVYKELGWVVSVGNINTVDDTTIDINGDTLGDFKITAASYLVSDTVISYISITGVDTINNRVIGTAIYMPYLGGINAALASAIPTDTLIKPSSGFIADKDAQVAVRFSQYSTSTLINSYGLTGLSDKYLGVKFRYGSSLLYGWLKVSVSSSGRMATIVDMACNTKGNSIKAGDKE